MKDLDRLLDKVDKVLEKGLPKDIDSLIEWGEKYANQRIIEEFKEIPHLDTPLGEEIRLSSFYVYTRIKELKQEG